MVSVIIPVYNVEKYLCECIESVINQTYKELEIILVDDGSTDDSGRICDKYKQLDTRIKVIHKKNGGLSSARNAGIEIATGSLYTFIDSDDFIALNMIESLLYALNKTNADISVCSMTSVENLINNSFSTKVNLYTKEETLKFILSETRIPTSACGKLYKKELFKTIRFPDGKIYEDLGTTYRVVDLVYRIALIDTPKYYYRRTNPQSITQTTFSNKQLDYYVISTELENFIKEKYPQFLNMVVNHSVRVSIAFMRKISICGFDDKNTINFLITHIKASILKYLFSGYSLCSKLYGLLICISPNTALSLFKCKKKKGRNL